MTNQTALIPLTDPRAMAVLAKVDTTGLTDAEKQELVLALMDSMEDSKAGFIFKPQRFTINKDACKFNDPLGNAVDEIRGIVLVKQRTRGWWDKKLQDAEDKKPICQSLDGLTGNMRTQLGDKEWSDTFDEVRDCTNCPKNAWGSATDEASGEERKGKACKEMRRMFIIPTGQQVPVMLSLPPTSIRPFDDFFSGRVTQGIADIAAEVIFELIPQTFGGYKVAVIKLKSGNKLAPKEVIELSKVKKQFETSWKQAEIDAEDYGDTGNTANTAPQQEITVDGDSAEPY